MILINQIKALTRPALSLSPKKAKTPTKSKNKISLKPRKTLSPKMSEKKL